MTLRRLTAGDVSALVPLATAKAHLRVTHTAEDALIGTYLRAAIRSCERTTGREFGAATWRLTLDNLPQVIELPRPAVSSVTALKIIDTDGVEQTVPGGDITLVSGDTVSYLSPATGAVWPAPAAVADAVTVTFVEHAGAADDDLTAAVLLFTAHLYRNREAVTADSLHVVPMAVDTLLQPYRLHFV